MSRAARRGGSVARLIQASGALVVLAILLAGVPLALAHFVGWPLPHRVPSLAQLRNGLTQHGVPSSLVIRALAVVCWVAWAALVASVTAEVASLARGRTAPRMLLAGPLQSLAAVLVTAIALGFTTPAGHAPDSQAPLHLALAARTSTAGQELVLNHDRLTRFMASPAPAATANATVVTLSPSALPADQTVPATTLYVVRHGDTLWSIAQDTLGDPLRWREIYALNEGRPQPGGAVLDDPHWIYPGWTLELPASGPAATPPLGSSPVAVPASSSLVVPPASVVAPIAPVRPPTSPAAPQAATTGHQAAGRVGTAPAPIHGRHVAGAIPAPVRLPSGSIVGGSFAAGVLSAVALGALRRRHAYRYRPPEPGRDLTPEPLRPTLRHLARTAANTGSGEDTSEPGPVLVVPFDGTEGRQHPGSVDLGIRNGETITVEITELSGTAICGQAADDIARALIAALLVRAGPGAAEVLLTTDLADRLLPGLRSDTAIRRAKSTDDVARAVQAETIARARRFAAAESPDATSYREQNPENPLPVLVVILDAVPDDSVGRWVALLAGASHLGIAVVFLADSPAATGRLITDARRTVSDVDPAALAERLGGAQLFGLGADEAVELLSAVADSHADEVSDDEVPNDQIEVDEPITVLHPDDLVDEPPPIPAQAGGPWPEPPHLVDEPDRPIVVQVLGPYRIIAHGEPVTTGLRSRAKALFAWYLVRPEGATSDEAVDALWPDTAPDHVQRQFWRPFGDLRARFRGPSDEALDVLEKTGEHYQPCAAEITCDMWEFQRALGEAARATEDEHARRVLRRAVDTYHGDLLAGSDYPWVEPIRQDLHRRALDAHLRLAELEDHMGHPDAAIATLEQAIDLDRYAEEPCRRLMTLHAARGRPDAVTVTWRLLQRRLAELDLDVEPATARLYRSLSATDASTADRSRPIRLSS
jgi:DNA-binding SARP family transcriptional activator